MRPPRASRAGLRADVVVAAGVALVAGFALGIYYATPEITPEATRGPTEREVAAAERLERWAYVKHTSQLSADEDLRLVVIPHQRLSASESFDEQCLIYRNRATGSAHFGCKNFRPIGPGAVSDDGQ